MQVKIMHKCTNSTAQGGGVSFKIGNLYIGEVGFCDACMAERVH